MGVLSRSIDFLLHSFFTSALLTQIVTCSVLCSARIAMWNIDFQLTTYCKREIYSEAARI